MADSVLDGAIKESVANANMKTVAEAGAFFMAQIFAQQTAHQNRMNVIAEAAVGRLTQTLVEEDPAQAAAALKILTGNDLAAQMAQLGSVIGSLQQMIKGAQTTPPNTGGGAS